MKEDMSSQMTDNTNTQEQIPSQNEQGEIIVMFMNAVKDNDASLASTYLEKIKKFPTGRYLHDDGRPITDNFSHNVAWKAHYMEELSPALRNEGMHSYIKDFFDIAVREDMNLIYSGEVDVHWYRGDGRRDLLSRQEMENYVHGYSFPSTSEGANDTVHFLKAYRKAKEQLAQEGREIFVPETFAEYPFLKDITEGITRYNNGDICYKTSLDGEATLYESPEISKKLEESLSFADLKKDLNFVKNDDDLRIGLLQKLATGKHQYNVNDLAKFYEPADRLGSFSRAVHYGIEKTLSEKIDFLTNDSKITILEKFNKDRYQHGATITDNNRIFLKTILESGVINFDPSKISFDFHGSLSMLDVVNPVNREQYELRKKQAGLLSQIERERTTSVNANENLQSLTDKEKKANFDQKKQLMAEHPIMIEPCLNSMCTSYVLTEDEKIKTDMLSDLYGIRKGGKTDKEKREMAKTFKRVLDKNPDLQKDENLVALGKVDTVISQPTKRVQKQVTR